MKKNKKLNRKCMTKNNLTQDYIILYFESSKSFQTNVIGGIEVIVLSGFLFTMFAIDAFVAKILKNILLKPYTQVSLYT